MDVVLIILKYLICTLIIITVIKKTFNSLWFTKMMLVHPLKSFILLHGSVIGIPVATYFIVPECSGAFILFITGQIIQTIWGRDVNEPLFMQSAFARKYGDIVNIITNIMMLISFIWGFANFF